MKSKITGGDTTLLFTDKILGKHDVEFYKCNDTGFIQTSDPHWLPEAYSSAITKLDVGLVIRNQNLSELCEPLIAKHFNHNASFLDYAGGYGLFTNMMRYKGFDFYHTDKYCQNIFAEFHDLQDYKGDRFEATTAFEVFEHLPNPIEEIKAIMSYADNLIFSTEIVPKNVTTDWWYFSFETGQHIAFYTIEALEFIAKKLNKHFYTNGQTVHLFTQNKLSSDPFEVKRDPFLVRKARKYVKKYDNQFKVVKPSFLDKDTVEAKRRIKLAHNNHK